jgi:hypothetical protein
MVPYFSYTNWDSEQRGRVSPKREIKDTIIILPRFSQSNSFFPPCFKSSHTHCLPQLLMILAHAGNQKRRAISDPLFTRLPIFSSEGTKRCLLYPGGLLVVQTDRSDCSNVCVLLHFVVFCCDVCALTYFQVFRADRPMGIKLTMPAGGSESNSQALPSIQDAHSIVHNGAGPGPKSIMNVASHVIQHKIVFIMCVKISA